MPMLAGRAVRFQHEQSVLQAEEQVRLDIEAPRVMTIGRYMSEPLWTAQSLGDDTHAVAMRRSWAREHGLHSVVWSVNLRR